MQLRLKLESRPGARRDDFIISPSNDLAVRMVEAWPAWPGGALALVGPPGVGKSHLADLWRERSGAVQITSVEQLAALTGGPALLEMDETPLDDESLFHLINLAARPSGGLLIATRTPPRQRQTVLPDLKSRLNALPTAEMGEPDDALLGELLFRLFDARGIRPPEELVSYLSTRMERSASSARALVEQMDAVADQTGRPIGRALAREILALDREADLG